MHYFLLSVIVAPHHTNPHGHTSTSHVHNGMVEACEHGPQSQRCRQYCVVGRECAGAGLRSNRGRKSAPPVPPPQPQPNPHSHAPSHPTHSQCSASNRMPHPPPGPTCHSQVAIVQPTRKPSQPHTPTPTSQLLSILWSNWQAVGSNTNGRLRSRPRTRRSHITPRMGAGPLPPLSVAI